MGAGGRLLGTEIRLEASHPLGAVQSGQRFCLSANWSASECPCEDTANAPHIQRLCIGRLQKDFWSSRYQSVNSHRCSAACLVAVDSGQAKVSQPDCPTTCHLLLASGLGEQCRWQEGNPGLLETRASDSWWSPLASLVGVPCPDTSLGLGSHAHTPGSLWPLGHFRRWH